ncbi:hypothetical protein DY000_02052424 [Brassica cretica]|uniref:Uncharacterized protein n=1 Tax=Brassica cretica TaxID=69181 RepID=A0ABQ7A979_BRACR|nr:hypothetical protein DY000_02052424 [Brassica cretica]
MDGNKKKRSAPDSSASIDAQARTGSDEPPKKKKKKEKKKRKKSIERQSEPVGDSEGHEPRWAPTTTPGETTPSRTTPGETTHSGPPPLAISPRPSVGPINIESSREDLVQSSERETVEPTGSDEPPKKKKKEKKKRKKSIERQSEPVGDSEGHEPVVHESSPREAATRAVVESSGSPNVPLEKKKKPSSERDASASAAKTPPYDGDTPLAYAPSECAVLIRQIRGGAKDMPPIKDLIFKDAYVDAARTKVLPLKQSDRLARARDTALNRKTSEFRAAIDKAAAEQSRLLADKKTQKEKFMERTTPGETTPNKATPSQTTPGETTPSRTTPGETTHSGLPPLAISPRPYVGPINIESSREDLVQSSERETAEPSVTDGNKKKKSGPDSSASIDAQARTGSDEPPKNKKKKEKKKRRKSIERQSEPVGDSEGHEPVVHEGSPREAATRAVPRTFR